MHVDRMLVLEPAYIAAARILGPGGWRYDSAIPVGTAGMHGMGERCELVVGGVKRRFEAAVLQGGGRCEGGRVEGAV